MLTSLPPQIGVDDLAYCSNLSSRWLREMSRNGQLPNYPGGRMPFVAALQMLFRWYQTDDAEMKAEKLTQAREKSAEMIRERLEAEGKLIDRDDAERRRVGSVRRYHGFVRELKERRSVGQRFNWLRELGVTPEICREFTKRDLVLAVDQINEIERRCNREVTEGIGGDGI